MTAVTEHEQVHALGVGVLDEALRRVAGERDGVQLDAGPLGAVVRLALHPREVFIGLLLRLLNLADHRRVAGQMLLHRHREQLRALLGREPQGGIQGLG